MIGFNKPYFSGNELQYIQEAIRLEKLSGNGEFTQRCQRFFEQRYGFRKTLLTQSCTAALEMAAILLDIKPGDEVIMPSYTFVSTANAFVLRGAKIVFADSNENEPNISVAHVAQLISAKTRAIVVVHYAGVACDMDTVMALAKKHNLFVVEDAAQAIDSFYRDKPLGSIGHLATFSFHETKNISSGEGGMLVVNDERFIKRAEIIWEKGTNRSAFFRGEVDKYNWVDVGSSFLPSEITAAFLWAQLEQMDFIQSERKRHWRYYWDGLKDMASAGFFQLPSIPDYASNNAHIFYLVTTSNIAQRALLYYLKSAGVQAIFHYLPLHQSPFYLRENITIQLPNAESFADRLIRLPLFVELTDEKIEIVIGAVRKCFEVSKSELVPLA
ncbi:MAG: dTDP-4-amino-4,6-dideoxygalactose transaminase, partial [Cytophagales bacterium]